MNSFDYHFDKRALVIFLSWGMLAIATNVLGGKEAWRVLTYLFRHVMCSASPSNLLFSTANLSVRVS